MKIHRAYTVLIVLLGSTVLACSDYTYRTRSALHRFQQSDYDGALKAYEKNKSKKTNRLLYLIDKGIVLHTAGRYEESIKTLQEAEDYSEKIDFVSVSSEIASIFTNERVRTYRGEAFERVLINVYKAIDYIMLGKIESALVECRRINEKLERYNEILKTDQRDPFPRYISGILFEANGDKNDAYIDYKLAHRIAPRFHYLAADLANLSRELAFMDQHEEWNRVFGKGYDEYRLYGKNTGEIVIIYENGLSPQKVSSEMHSQAQIIPIPVYQDRPTSISHAEIFIGGKFRTKTYILSDIGKISKAYLERRVGEYVAKGLARLAVKEGAAVAVGKYVDRDLGILLGVAMLFTNRADLRSALTLPENIQLGRIFIKEGKYDVELRFSGKGGGHVGPPKLFRDVSVRSGKKTFLNYRTFE